MGSPDWETVAMNVSRSFHERFPRNNIDAKQFSLISQLFQEAVHKSQHGFAAEDGSHGWESSTSFHQFSLPVVSNEPQTTSSSAIAAIGTYG